MQNLIFEKSKSIDPYQVPFFWGRLLRNEAVLILERHGCTPPGLFLLRESIYEVGSFAISICNSNKSISHFLIKRQPNGNVKIEGGSEFLGPIELINHNKKKLDGLKIEPSMECNRTTYDTIFNFKLIENDRLKKLIDFEIKKSSASKSYNPHFYYKYIRMILKSLHQSQQWFLFNIDRKSAEDRLKNPEMIDGRFLVRCSSDSQEYKISLCNSNRIYHYKIFTRAVSNEQKTYFIENGQEFDSIFAMIDTYNRSNMDGLKCLLLYPYPMHQQPRYQTSPCAHYIEDNKVLNTNDVVLENDADDDMSESEESESMFKINENKLIKKEAIGFGEFGEVYKYLLKRKTGEFNNKLIVAGKEIQMKFVQNEHELKNQRTLVEQEANIIYSLNCPYIITLIGICEKEASSLILLEFAPLGSLRDYLRKTTDLPITKIIKLCYQIALAMEYLSEKNIIHRDLALRNVLLFSEDSCKLSDFGLARSLEEKTYYRCTSNSRIAFKWVAPESIRSQIFNEKTDVWGFGITFWEGLSFGQEPYGNEVNANLQKIIENGHRLEKPNECSLEFYDIMLKCWRKDPEMRPKFKEIKKELKDALYNIYQIDLEAQMDTNSRNIYKV